MNLFNLIYYLIDYITIDHDIHAIYVMVGSLAGRIECGNRATCALRCVLEWSYIRWYTCDLVKPMLLNALDINLILKR